MRERLLAAEGSMADGDIVRSPHSDADGADTHDANEAALARRPGCVFGGVMDDARRRSRYCASDWSDPCRSIQSAQKSVSGVVFMFMALWFTEVALAESAREDTNNSIGVTEFLLVNCAAGFVQSLFGPQPLVVLRPTGPVVLVTVQLYQLSRRVYPDELDQNSITTRFLQLYSATGVFVALYMTVIAAFELSRFCASLTRFTLEVFEAFVCSVTFWLGFQRIVLLFYIERSDEFLFGDALFSLMLSCITFGVGMVLSSIGTVKVFNPGARRLLAEYGVAVAVILTVGISFAPSHADARVNRIPMPAEFSPTYSNRTWGVNLAAVLPPPLGTSPWWTLLIAAVAAIPVTALFYVDQNVTGLLLQRPSAKLRKGSYYHGSFLLVAVINGLAPIMGLPFISGSLPHSPQFARALSKVDERGAVIEVVESRIAPMIMYLGVGLTLLVPKVLEQIPDGASHGVLCFIGIKGLFQGNQFVERCLLLVVAPSEFSDEIYTKVPCHVMHAFTAIQLACFGVCWVVTLDFGNVGLGLGFPLVILAFVPLRSYFMRRWFTEADLAALDSS